MTNPFASSEYDYFCAPGIPASYFQSLDAETFARTVVKIGGLLVDVSGTPCDATTALPILTDAAAALEKDQPDLARWGVTFVPLWRGSDRFHAVRPTGAPIPGTRRTWAELERAYAARAEANQSGQPTR